MIYYFVYSERSSLPFKKSSTQKCCVVFWSTEKIQFSEIVLRKAFRVKTLGYGRHFVVRVFPWRLLVGVYLRVSKFWDSPWARSFHSIHLL